jgi:hypothetical protein
VRANVRTGAGQEIMGKCESVGKCQSALIMANPIISPRTRSGVGRGVHGPTGSRPITSTSWCTSASTAETERRKSALSSSPPPLRPQPPAAAVRVELGRNQARCGAWP